MKPTLSGVDVGFALLGRVADRMWVAGLVGG